MQTLFKGLKVLKEQRMKTIMASDILEATVKRHPSKVALILDDKEWTFQMLDDFSNRVANHFRSQGFVQGDDVAVMMENTPEYVGVVFGLWKLGVVTALINTNLRLDMLAHSMNTIKAKAIVFSASLHGALQDILPSLEQDCTGMLYSVCGEEAQVGTKMLEREIETASHHSPPPVPNRGFEGDLFSTSIVPL